MQIADIVTDRAAIGAANTLIFREDGKIHADNTGYGFIANLTQNAPDWRPDQGAAAVIGAGGAARAVVASLLESGVPELRITNHTKLQTEQDQERILIAKVVVYDWAQAGNMLEGATTVVNATSWEWSANRRCRVPLDALSGALVTDPGLYPLMTDFLLEAQSRGCQVVDGLGMLLHQAAPGFERWFGRRPEVDEALRQAVL